MAQTNKRNTKSIAPEVRNRLLIILAPACPVTAGARAHRQRVIDTQWEKTLAEREHPARAGGAQVVPSGAGRP